MRPTWLAPLVMLAMGCQGQPVEALDAAPDAPTSDALPDAPVPDAPAVDSSTPDSPVPDAGADVGSCAPIASNLIPDGDFSTGAGGWMPYQCKAELVAGRCAKALRVYDVAPYGRVGRAYDAPLAAGTRLRLRAWFKKSPTGNVATNPVAWIRSYSHDDAGVETAVDYQDYGTAGDDWTLAETVITLKNRQEAFIIYLEAGEAKEVLVADVSLVAE